MTEGEDLHSSSSRHDGRVTVVVLTHNRVQEVLRTIGHLVRLPENPTIIVMDNASSDGTSWSSVALDMRWNENRFIVAIGFHKRSCFMNDPMVFTS